MEEIFDNPQEILINAFLESCIAQMKVNPPRISKCLDQISEEQLWDKPNNQTNSIGNLILHLCGNITQYIISGLGEEPDNRRREEEFATTGGMSKSQLLKQISDVTHKAVTVMETLGADKLVNDRVVQGFRLSGFGIVVHVVEHYSYHVGQIALLTKLLTNKDLGFYENADLNKLN